MALKHRLPYAITQDRNQKYVLSTCSRSTFALTVDLMPHEVPKDSTEDIDDSSDESLSEVLQAGYDWVLKIFHELTCNE